MSDNKKREKYYVRCTTDKDRKNLMKFYKKNPHKSVADRTNDVMDKLIDNGSVVIIESEKGDIVGASASYPINAEENGIKQTKWIEVGATRMVLNGYPGLFNIMIATQALRAVLVEPPLDRLVAEMKDPPVQQMAKNLGWRELRKPSPEMVKESYRILHDKASAVYDVNDSQDDWFHCGPEGVPVMAKLMMDVVKNPVITNRKTGEEIEVSYERSSFVKLLLGEIEVLSKKNNGSVDNPSLKTSLRESRDKWLLDLR
jgi:hypothetical protein